MSRIRNILLRLALMVAVIACFGLNTSSHQFGSFNTAPISLESNIAANVVSNDIDSFDEDQINQLLCITPTFELIDFVVSQIDNKLIIKHPFFIWQPPKSC